MEEHSSLGSKGLTVARGGACGGEGKGGLWRGGGACGGEGKG